MDDMNFSNSYFLTEAFFEKIGEEGEGEVAVTVKCGNRTLKASIPASAKRAMHALGYGVRAALEELAKEAARAQVAQTEVEN